MRVTSVNVSMGRTISWRGREVTTGIFKEPVPGRVMLRTLGVDGDRQADLTVHGGEYKAVYSYAVEHYTWWHAELGRALQPGTFGENLTIEGIDESDIAIGDRFSVGGALLEAVQPRLPCYKIGVRFDDAGMVRRFMKAARFGTYFRVLQEGDVGVGDEMTRIHRDAAGVQVVALTSMLDARSWDEDLVLRALRVDALPPSWREHLMQVYDVPADP